MKHWMLQRWRAHRRRSRVQATGTTDFVGAAAIYVVAFAGLRAPAQCLHTGSQGAEQEQSQDQDDHAPMHTAPVYPISQPTRGVGVILG